VSATATGTDRFAVARAVADAVLYEGYVLYPYRASARKNQLRWQFGVLVPPAGARADPSERAAARTEVIVDPGQEAALRVRVRCLQVQHRDVEAVDAAPGGFAPVERLAVDDRTWVPWDEAVEHEIDLPAIRLLPLAGAAAAQTIHLGGGEDVELLRSSDGVVTGRAVRRREAIDGLVRVGATWADGPGALVKLTIDLENTTEGCDGAAGRDALVRRSLIAVHVLLAVDDGAFVSALDPPEFALAAVAGCRQDGLFPVLVGDAGSQDVMLASPIILYDHPEVAPESVGDFCDATEIDEILALRVLTLTDEEKAEARGTDARAAGIVDRCDDLPPEMWARLHGAVRSLRPIDEADDEPPALPWWDPAADAEVDPWTDTTTIGGRQVGKGTRVRLRPSRRADAHDLFLAGRTATIAGVFSDVDGDEHVAVSLDDDPAAELLEWQGRFLFFHTDELELLP
jgi:hypothetical protein